MGRDRKGNPDTSEYARTVGALGRQYRKFFGTTVVAALLLQVTLVTDTIIVGQLLGPVPMSGVRVASPIVDVLLVLATAIGAGGSTVISIAMGQRDGRRADCAFTLSIALCIAAGFLFALVIVPLADLIANAVSSDGSTAGYTATFLRVVGVAGPVYIMASAMAVLLRTDGFVKLSSAILVVSGIANVVFDLLLMGFFGMGVEGAALATDASLALGTLLSLAYFASRRRTLHLRMAPARASVALMADIFKNGAAGSLRLLLACAALLFLNYVVGAQVGVWGIALLTVCGNIQLLAIALFSAGGQAAMPMEGVLFGERDFGGLRLLLRYVMRITLVAVAVVMALVWLFPSQIIALFVPEGIVGGEWPLRLYALGFLPLALNYLLMYHYNTIQRRSISVALTVCENCLFYLPLIWFLTGAYGVGGAVEAFVISEYLSFAALLAMAEIARRKGGFGNLLLLRETPSDLVFEATVPATDVDAAQIGRRVKGALDESGVPSVTSIRAGVAVEEMIANTVAFRQNAERNVLFDVRVMSLPEHVLVTLRYDGAPFDPTTYAPHERDEFELDGITALRAIASDLDYSFSMGLNLTVVEVETAKEGSSPSGQRSG